MLTLVHDLPNVSFRVLTYAAGAHSGMDGPFSLMEFDTALPLIASITTLTSQLYVESDEDVRQYCGTRADATLWTRRGAWSSARKGNQVPLIRSAHSLSRSRMRAICSALTP